MLISLTVLLATTLPASDFESGGLGYSINEDGKSVTVTNSTIHQSLEGDLEIPSTATYQSMTYAVTSIGEKAFYYCTGVTSVTIPASVTSIGNKAFGYCISLAAINLPEQVMDIGAGSFEGTAWFNSQPAGLVYLGKIAYQYNGNGGAPDDTNITIKDGTIQIADDCFGWQYWLTSVSIPNSVKSIGNRAFYCCQQLSSVKIPASVTSIGKYAFAECESLEMLDIPASVTWIGENAFSFTPWLNNQYGMIYAGSVAYIYIGTMPENTSIVIEDGTQSIAPNCFYGCKALTSVSIPNSVKHIGDYAFGACTGLNAIDTGNSVSTIGKGAFNGCSALRCATLGKTVRYIGDGAFRYCTSIEEIKSYGNATDIVLGRYSFGVFEAVPKDECRLRVPAEYVTAYQEAPQWKDFHNIIGDLKPMNDTFDVNQDGDINVGDVNTILEAILSQDSAPALDVNNDGKIDVGDVNTILDSLLN